MINDDYDESKAMKGFDFECFKSLMKKYIQKMVGTYENMLGSKKSHKWSSPLEYNDHPELDTSEFLDVDMKVKYPIQQYHRDEVTMSTRILNQN